DDVGTDAKADSSVAEAGDTATSDADGTVADTAPDGDGGLDADTAPPPPTTPQPLYPLSNAVVTSQQPTLRWKLPPGADGARIELCPDRSCASITPLDAVGTSKKPPDAFGNGLVYWRLRARTGSVVSPDVGPTWAMYVGVKSAAVDTSWGTNTDVNGDHFADLVVGAPNHGA